VSTSKLFSFSFLINISAILTSFDNRLVKLEKSILPLYTSTQILTRRGNSWFFWFFILRFILNSYQILDIESALQKIDDVASNQEGIAEEEALILRGCVPLTLDNITAHFSSAFPKALSLVNLTSTFTPWNA
jgi:hypothetical protein